MSVLSSSNLSDKGITVVLGSQWGDEGKGKLVDILAQEADVCARCAVSVPLSSRFNPFPSNTFHNLCFFRVEIMLDIPLLLMVPNLVSISFPPVNFLIKILCVQFSSK